MTILSNAEGRALLASMSKQGKKAGYKPASITPPVDPSKLASQSAGARGEAKNTQSPERTEEQNRDARPRPRFAVSLHDFGGKRFVAHGLTNDQAAALCQAAEAAGIQEQN